jgi:PAS domain S-box-containing protein
MEGSIPMGRWRGDQPTTVRARVRWLVLACIVPAWLLAVAISYFSYERERDSIVHATVQIARSLVQGVERDLATRVAVLQTLATSTLIDERNFARFRERAAQVLKHSAADNIVLFDTELQGLMSVAHAAGVPLPKLKIDRFPSVIATGQPAVSDYFVGQFSEQPQIAVAVPVIRHGKVVGRLEMVFSVGRLAQFHERQSFAPGWIAAVLDSQGVIVARNRAAEQFVGKSATDGLLRQLQQRSEGSFAGLTADGIEVIGCFSRSSAYGWAVAIGVPEAVLAAELKRRLMLYGLGGLVLLGLGLALANLIGRSITEPIQALVAPALAIGRGETALIEPSALREVTGLGAALKDAQALLRQRELAREQAEDSLRDSQARLRMALEVSQIGDWDLDLKTGVIQHSLRHDQCFGYTEPIADWNVEIFFSRLHPDERESARAHMAQRLRLGESWQREYRIIWPDGSLHWIATQGTTLRENGVPYFIVGLISDITDRKQNEELRLNGVRLEAENRQIQESNRIKSEFLANMSHELRTPLNAIIGFADILRTMPERLGPEKQQAYLGHIASSGRHLLQLINDVLDLSKVESGKFEFFPEPVDLTRLAREVTGVLYAEAARKNITLETEHDPGLDDLVLDPSRLKQMLYNFLSNAIKFTGSGGRVVLRSCRQGPDQLRIEVEDTGIGIAPADQHKLFHQFQQIQSGYAKPHPGTGLGLALTKRLAELQGGSVGVRSSPGVGSVFYLVLPRRAGPGGHGPAPLPERAVVQGAPKVLVIEDEVVDQARLVQILHSAGFEVDLAATGERALQLASGRRYDAITLDLLLPDRSGLDVLAALRAGGQNRDVPVVVVTMVTEASALAGFQINDVLTKPISTDEIVAALHRAGLRASAEPRVLVVDDDPAALELMAATLQAIGMTALCVPNGAAALASLDQERPDAMVLDLLMPGMNGFDVLHALRQRPEAAQVPVFIWTSMTLSADEMASLARSAQAVVAKGQGGVDVLVERVRAWHAGRQGGAPS